MTRTVAGGASAVGSAPAPFTVPNHWDLEASPGTLQDAAQGWRRLATAARAQAKNVDGPARRLQDGGWQGEAAESYDHHRQKLTGDVREVASSADRVAGVLESVATILTNTQTRLLDVLSAQSCPSSWVGNQVTFMPRTAKDESAAHQAMATAEVIRHELDGELSGHARALGKAQSAFRFVASMWGKKVGKPSFVMPPASNRPAFIYDRKTGQYIVDTAGGDPYDMESDVEVKYDPKTGGSLVVLGDGEVFSVKRGDKLTILGSAGNDYLDATNDKLGLTFFGGDGGNTVEGGSGNDQIIGGAGDDFLDGNGGNDRISGGGGTDVINGGDGNDVLDGGSGEGDQIWGDSGDDRLTGGNGDTDNGGPGDDVIVGGDGSDLLGGGSGNDLLLGGRGDDQIWPGHGVDTINGGDGSDQVAVKPPHEGGQNSDIVINGERLYVRPGNGVAMPLSDMM